jgi:hypothetical protein
MTFVSSYRHHVQDEYFFEGPVVDARITATFPEGFKFGVFSSTSSPFANILDGDTLSVWEARGGILPRQGYVFYLTRKPLESTEI